MSQMQKDIAEIKPDILLKNAEGAFKQEITYGTVSESPSGLENGFEKPRFFRFFKKPLKKPQKSKM